MKIGVIVPHYNQIYFLDKQLAALGAQRRMPDSLIVVDDGSDKYQPDYDAEDLAKEYGWDSLMKPDNHGAAVAINVGVDSIPEHGTDDCLTWVSADNIQYESWLETLAKVMEDPEVGACYSGYDAQSINEAGQPTDPSMYRFFPWNQNRLIAGEGCFYGPSFLIRASVWREAGPHRGKISHDYDHWARVEEVCAKRKLQILGLDTPLCRYGVHPEMATERLKDQYDADHWRQEALKRRGML